MGSQGRSGKTGRLERHRKDVSDIDQEIVRLLSKRADLVSRIWDLKLELGMPLEDPRQERQVRLRARRWARDYGMDPELAEKVISWILASMKQGLAVSHRKSTKGRPVSLKR